MVQEAYKIKTLEELKGRTLEDLLHEVEGCKSGYVLFDAGVFIWALLTGDSRHAEA